PRLRAGPHTRRPAGAGGAADRGTRPGPRESLVLLARGEALRHAPLRARRLLSEAARLQARASRMRPGERAGVLDAPRRRAVDAHPESGRHAGDPLPRRPRAARLSPAHVRVRRWAGVAFVVDPLDPACY